MGNTPWFLAFLAPGVLGLAPSFGKFCTQSCGSYTGASTRWSSGPCEAGAVSIAGLADEPFSLSVPAAPTETSVEERARACGGAVQGVVEKRACGEDAVVEELYANRADDGFAFFDDGSWLVARADGSVEASLAHSGGARRRFSVACAPHTTGSGAVALATVDVALELSAAFAGREDANAHAARHIDALLEGSSLDLVTEAETWVGGATERLSEARRADGLDAWIAARAQWRVAETFVAGGEPLTPPLAAGVAVLPAMAFVRRTATGLALISMLPGECVKLTRTLDDRGELAMISLAHLKPTDPDDDGAWDWDDEHHAVEHEGHDHD